MFSQNETRCQMKRLADSDFRGRRCIQRCAAGLKTAENVPGGLVYARVSTKGSADLTNAESRAMREYVVRRGWTIALHVREVDSSAAKREDRGESWRRRAAGTLMQSRMADWTNGAGQSQTYWQRFAPRPLDNQVKPLDAECARITWMSSD